MHYLQMVGYLHVSYDVNWQTLADMSRRLDPISDPGSRTIWGTYRISYLLSITEVK